MQLLPFLRFTHFPYHNDPSIRPENFRSPEEQIVIANPRRVDSAVLGEVVIRQGLDLEFVALLAACCSLLFSPRRMTLSNILNVKFFS